jgi:uncharacterized protein (DUF1330 family)
MASEAKGYWLVSAVITDPEKFQGYVDVAGPVIGAAGGRPVARGDVFEVAEGTPAGRPFVIEFPSFQAAKDCYASPEYQAAIELRKDAARFDLVIAEGLESA